MKIIVFGTACWTLAKFRGSMLEKLVGRGHNVITIGSNSDDLSLQFLNTIGVHYHEINFDKSRTNIVSILCSMKMIFSIFLKYKPDVCLAFFLKPIFICSIIKLFYSFRLISLIEGLGHTFMKPKKSLLRRLATYLVRFTVLMSNKVVFFNNLDLDEILANQKKNYQNKVFLLRGMGVDLNYYSCDFKNNLNDTTNFLFLSRLLKSKGLPEFLKAAICLKNNSSMIFSVYGQLDDSEHGVSKEFLNNLHNEGIIHYGGLIYDVREPISKCDVLVLPTYYREGLPRCIQEAMSMGRPVITTDFSACSDIIIDKLNGYIIPRNDVASLIKAMDWFSLNKQKNELFSLESRKAAERYFDSSKSDTLLIELIENKG